MAELKITAESFSAEVENADCPVLVDFWAPWCAPCRMLAPILSELAEETAGVKVGKVNVDEEGLLAARFGIRSIPTLILFKDGKPVAQMVGVHSKAELKAFVED